MFSGNGSVSGDLSAAPGWSWQQDKLFEQALVVFPEGTPDRWEKIAQQVPGKTPSEVRLHYEDLIHDVFEIDSGRVEPPSYAGSCGASSSGSRMTRPGESERKKGVPWTEEEHRLFLIGLQKYGKGDWRSISRNAVVTRTPTQVASHAQKYYLRLNSIDKKKRASIHDITAADNLSAWAQPAGRMPGPFDTGTQMGLNGCFDDYGGEEPYGFPFPM